MKTSRGRGRYSYAKQKSIFNHFIFLLFPGPRLGKSKVKQQLSFQPLACAVDVCVCKLCFNEKACCEPHSITKLKIRQQKRHIKRDSLCMSKFFSLSLLLHNNESHFQLNNLVRCFNNSSLALCISA